MKTLLLSLIILDSDQRKSLKRLRIPSVVSKLVVSTSTWDWAEFVEILCWDGCFSCQQIFPPKVKKGAPWDHHLHKIGYIQSFSIWTGVDRLRYTTCFSNLSNLSDPGSPDLARLRWMPSIWTLKSAGWLITERFTIKQAELDLIALMKTPHFWVNNLFAWVECVSNVGCVVFSVADLKIV